MNSIAMGFKYPNTVTHVLMDMGCSFISLFIMSSKIISFLHRFFLGLLVLNSVNLVVVAAKCHEGFMIARFCYFAVF